MRTHKIALTTVMIGAVLLGACSDGDDDASDGDTTTTTPTEVSVTESTLVLPESEDPTTTAAGEAPEEVTTVVDKVVFGDELDSNGGLAEEGTSFPASLEKMYYVMVLDSIAAGETITVELRQGDTSLGEIGQLPPLDDPSAVPAGIVGEIRPTATGLTPGDYTVVVLVDGEEAGDGSLTLT